jgi:hypothetical protein
MPRSVGAEKRGRISPFSSTHLLGNFPPSRVHRPLLCVHGPPYRPKIFASSQSSSSLALKLRAPCKCPISRSRLKLLPMYLYPMHAGEEQRHLPSRSPIGSLGRLNMPLLEGAEDKLRPVQALHPTTNSSSFSYPNSILPSATV